MYFTRTPHIARLLYPDLLWKVKTDKKNIYITFDDGPAPEVTPEALDLLASYDARATFFCVGERVEKHPELYRRVLEQGHTTGNHTWDHLMGTRTDTIAYLASVEKAARLVRSNLFRPPYGKITGRQVRQLRDNYRIVMWSVLPGDFDRHRTREQVREAAVRHTKGGSIVVFHDNMKFKEKMLFALEGFLKHFTGEGYRFLPLEPAPTGQ